MMDIFDVFDIPKKNDNHYIVTYEQVNNPKNLLFDSFVTFFLINFFFSVFTWYISIIIHLSRWTHFSLSFHFDNFPSRFEINFPSQYGSALFFNIACEPVSNELLFLINHYKSISSVTKHPRAFSPGAPALSN